MRKATDRIQAALAAVLVLAAGTGSAKTLHVNASSASPVPPYTNWATAASSIQAAVNVAVDGDLVLVTNGVYGSAGAADATNVVLVTKGVTVASVNGPLFTTIDGGGGRRCLRMAHALAAARGFTLTRGLAALGGGLYLAAGATAEDLRVLSNVATSNGGGVYCATNGTLRNSIVVSNRLSSGDGGGGMYIRSGGLISNCTVSDNAAPGNGGGIYLFQAGTARNCLVARNSAGHNGGGIYHQGDATTRCCTVVNNSAVDFGGGMAPYGGTVADSIIYFNSAATDANAAGSAITFCCLTPLPPGAGNIDGDPRFDGGPAGPYTLGANSPCINAGTNEAWMAGATDLAGNLRIQQGTVDLGAHESPYSEPAETLGVPPRPDGPAEALTGERMYFSTTGTSSDLGHPLQYLFSWGDGTDAGWLPVGEWLDLHAWATAGVFQVRVRARCSVHTNALSAWSEGLSVSIRPPDSISTPAPPVGPATGQRLQSLTYNLGGARSSQGHAIQYQIDWADSSYSGWLPVGTTNLLHIWATAGTYNVRSIARCATHTNDLSAWSPSLLVTIYSSPPPPPPPPPPPTWAKSYKMTFDRASDVQLLRAYRDTLLRTDTNANAYVHWLYAHSEKALALVLASPEVRKRCAAIMNDRRDALDRALRGQPVVIEDPGDLIAFCELVSREDRGELGTMAGNIRQLILAGAKSGRPLFGITFGASTTNRPVPAAARPAAPRAPRGR